MYERIDNSRKKVERWLTELAQNIIFVRIMFKLDVKLDLRMFIY